MSTFDALRGEIVRGIRRTTYKDQVIERIYDLVLEGKYRAGEQIKETVMAKEMGISRAPVREAFRELIANGIVEYRPQVGNFIANLSAKEIVDAYTTRGILEGYTIMSTRQQFTADDIEALGVLVERMRRSAAMGNRRSVVDAGGAFHDLLVEKNDNVQLAEYTSLLSLKLHVLFFRHWATLYSPDEIGERHQRIVDSLVAGEPVAIEKVVRDHYVETGTKIAEICQEEENNKEQEAVD